MSARANRPPDPKFVIPVRPLFWLERTAEHNVESLHRSQNSQMGFGLVLRPYPLCLELLGGSAEVIFDRTMVPIRKHLYFTGSLHDLYGIRLAR